MIKSEYLEKLKDPRWQKKRLEIFNRDNFTCRSCGETKKPLNAHHQYYKSGNDPWDYESESIVTLCEDCHIVEPGERQFIEGELLLILKKKGFVADDLLDIVEAIKICDTTKGYTSLITSLIYDSITQKRSENTNEKRT